jgi:hypothetical protein
MKKLLFLALGAILAVNINAKEVKADNEQGKKDCKMSKEERIEKEIKILTEELYLSEEQAGKFAATYRDYANKLDAIFAKKADKAKEQGKELSDKELDQINKARLAAKKEVIELKEKFYDKFRKDLNPRQAERAINFRGCQCKHGGQCQQGGKKPHNGKIGGPQRAEFKGDRVPDRKPRGEQPRELKGQKELVK